MAQGGQPRYPLGAVKTAFPDAARLNRTMSAADGAEALDLNEHAVADVIARLTSRDFNKSMPSASDAAVWQDVYKPVVDGRELYVKFTIDAQGNFLLISFKGN